MMNKAKFIGACGPSDLCLELGIKQHEFYRCCVNGMPRIGHGVYHKQTCVEWFYANASRCSKCNALAIGSKKCVCGDEEKEFGRLLQKGLVRTVRFPHCEMCGRAFAAKTKNAKFCGNLCARAKKKPTAVNFCKWCRSKLALSKLVPDGFCSDHCRLQGSTRKGKDLIKATKAARSLYKLTEIKQAEYNRALIKKGLAFCKRCEVEKPLEDFSRKIWCGHRDLRKTFGNAVCDDCARANYISKKRLNEFKRRRAMGMKILPKLEKGVVWHAEQERLAKRQWKIWLAEKAPSWWLDVYYWHLGQWKDPRLTNAQKYKLKYHLNEEFRQKEVARSIAYRGWSANYENSYGYRGY